MDFIEIGSLLSASRHFIIPDYQREYSWERTQNLTLWTDIEELLNEKKTKHFLGALVTSPYQKGDTSLAVIRPEQYDLDATEVTHLLDGQQRITSISLLIAAILKTVEEDDKLDEIKASLLSESLRSLLFDGDNTDEKDNPSPRLFLKEESGKYYYREILNVQVSGKTDKRYKSVKNMDKAFKGYCEKISSWNTCEDPDDRYDNYSRLISAIKNRVQVVDIRCGKNMNEFQVFESLNGKGLNLTAIDRIRSIYLSNAQVAKADGSSKWQAIYSKLECDDKEILHFFTSFFFYREKKRVSKISLPDYFKRMARDNYQTFTALNADLQDAAARYASLRHATTENKDADEVLEEIKELRQEQIYVPLYAAASVSGFDSDQFVSFSKKLLNYAVRNAICGKPANALDAEFSKIIEKLKDDTSFEPAIEYIERHSEDDEVFQRQFAKFSTKNSSFARYLLKKLETDRRLEEGDGSRVPKDPSLEHIIPQTIDYEKWFTDEERPGKAILDSFREDVIDRIGNMALLNQCDNSAASNKDYETKRKIYLEGTSRVKDYGIPANTYVLIQDLVDQYQDSFAQDEVEERSEMLAKRAVNIWSIK